MVGGDIVAEVVREGLSVDATERVGKLL